MKTAVFSLTKLANLANMRLVMKIVSIHKAKTNLSKYIADAKKGQKILIGSHGKPEVMLIKVTPADLAKSQTRDFSIGKNRIVEQADSFSQSTETYLEELLTKTE